MWAPHTQAVGEGELGREVGLSGGREDTGAWGYTSVTHSHNAREQEWALLVLQTPVSGTELGRAWGSPFCCSRTEVPRSLTGPSLTKHPDLVEIVSLGMNRLPHLAKSWRDPSRDTLSPFPPSPTDWFTRSLGPNP